MVTGFLSDPTSSPEGLCSFAKKKGVQISKQGLHQRFKAEAALLMQEAFSESVHQFKTKNQMPLDLLKPFASVKIFDSSEISLPACFKKLFRGSQRKSEAALKLQTMFDYVHGQMNDTRITGGCDPDQGYNGHLEHLEKGVLYLFDLGYFKLNLFEAMANKKSFFICRYFSTNLFDEHLKTVDLLGELKKSGDIYSRTFLVGRELKKNPIRVVAYRLTGEVLNRRLSNIKESFRRRGKTPSKQTLEFAQWSIYMTNAPEEIPKDKQIHTVYTLRWQIELLFKLFKSEANIDKIRCKKPDRLLCEIYAKLICIVMLLYFCFPIRWQENGEISFCKAYKVFKKMGLAFLEALKNKKTLKQFLKKLFDDLSKFTFKDKYRKKRRASYEKIMDIAGQEAMTYG